MKITIISGSARANSQSRKVSQYISERLKTLNVDTEVYDLGELNLPSFDAMSAPTEPTLEILSALESSDGAVFVCPEWDGMMSHVLINLYHYMGQQLADKPVTLVGVSANNLGGQYPVEQMTSMGMKNRHFVVVPERLVINNVNDVLNDDDQSETASDIYIKKRTDYTLKVLVEYAKALAPVRESNVRDFTTYPYGM